MYILYLHLRLNTNDVLLSSILFCDQMTFVAVLCPPSSPSPSFFLPGIKLWTPKLCKSKVGSRISKNLLYLGKPQKCSFFIGPATKREGLTTKKKELFLKVQKIVGIFFCQNPFSAILRL